MAAQNEINAFRVRARRKSPRCLPYVAGIGNACLARKALCRPQPLARRCASVASPIRCRRLRAAIGAQRQAQRAAHTERIGKRCNAALRFDGQREPTDDR
ncbi:hypothetical protein [Verminephrobacter eiseniae]|uniref:hypothetical protein n=1 Tax=Verminephrobacter eiseniae TaxID=364317 RepID=UPI0022448106|nr:hypothetical protein [Verminephrobacter eiseniae]